MGTAGGRKVFLDLPVLGKSLVMSGFEQVVHRLNAPDLRRGVSSAWNNHSSIPWLR